MDNTIDALKNLYAALGGTAADVADKVIIPDLINAIATYIANGGAAERPAVSSGNNGNVLTVVNGKWAAAVPANPLPAVTAANDGEVLTVVSGAWSSADPAAQLPTVSASNDGEVLTVVSGKWAAASLPQ